MVQKNPVNEYKIVSADVYNEMIQSIKRDTTSFLLRIKPQEPKEETQPEEEQEFVSRREKKINEKLDLKLGDLFSCFFI